MLNRAKTSPVNPLFLYKPIAEMAPISDNPDIGHAHWIMVGPLEEIDPGRNARITQGIAQSKIETKRILFQCEEIGTLKNTWTTNGMFIENSGAQMINPCINLVWISALWSPVNEDWIPIKYGASSKDEVTSVTKTWTPYFFRSLVLDSAKNDNPIIPK